MQKWTFIVFCATMFFGFTKNKGDNMNPWINYHHLYYFKTIAEEGSVSKAAEKLLIGQPTLSAQLKQFEENLDIQLFYREHRKLIITEQGKVAFEYAKNIFNLGSEMYEVLQDRVQPHKQSLHIGALDSIPKQIVTQLTKRALALDSCQVTLSESDSDTLLRELSAHKIDLVLTNFLPSGTSSKGIFPRLVTKKNVSIYGTKKFLKLKKDFPHSLSGVPMILPTYDSKMRADLEHWAKLNNIYLNIIVESQDVAVKKLLATESVALLPAATHTVERQTLNGELVEIGKLRGVSEELYLLSAQRKIPNSVAEKLFETFKV